MPLQDSKDLQSILSIVKGFHSHPLECYRQNQVNIFANYTAASKSVYGVHFSVVFFFSKNIQASVQASLYSVHRTWKKAIIANTVENNYYYSSV